jgi:hypothetical protein
MKRAGIPWEMEIIRDVEKQLVQLELAAFLIIILGIFTLISLIIFNISLFI